MEQQRGKPGNRFTKLRKRLARLESLNDQLHTELTYVDSLLRAAGFEEGLTTLKSAAVELIALEG